jgi:CheY-like chemotaxis protein
MARVLVVDDQPDVRMLVQGVLRHAGHEVDVAPGGAQAVKRLSEGDPPDLIVLDVQMPDMDGWDTLAEIRLRYGKLGPRVVLCTVKAHARDLLHGWTLGCDGYVWKPFDVDLLAGEIEQALALKPTERIKLRNDAIAETQMMLRDAI